MTISSLCIRASVTDSLYHSLTGLPEEEQVDSLVSFSWNLKYQDPVTAGKIASRAYNISREIDYQKGIIKSCNILGIVYSSFGDFENSLRYFLEAVPVVKEAKESQVLAQLYMNIGAVYAGQALFEKSNEYYRMAIAIARFTHDTLSLANTWSNIGLNHYYADQYDSAMYFMNLALDYYKQAGNVEGISICYGNIGLVYEAEGNGEAAKSSYRKALELCYELGDNVGAGYNLVNLAYVASEGNDSSDFFIGEALRLGMQTRNSEIISSSYEAMMELAMMREDYETAFGAQRKLDALRDSVSRMNISSYTSKIEMDYEIRLAEMEEEKRRILEAKQHKDEVSRQYMMIFAVIILLFAGIFLMPRVRINRRIRQMFIFLTLMLFFEFIILLVEPLLDPWTGGVPIPKLVMNGILALTFTYLHTWLEKKFRTLAKSNPSTIQNPEPVREYKS